ncbi:COX15/CtaA family protein [Asticcacaulis solisilvae]|uniref:COX15/CtaA family protein n=1 Tax=Asticcacaulis solisilvae TaxID=1217274 RepID=UPI003FD739DE
MRSPFKSSNSAIAQAGRKHRRTARLPLRSPTVAAWLFAAVFTILVLLVVGGATRLTTSGLSITEWKPISGIIPPGSDAAWAMEFANYKKIPQYTQLNPHMTVAQFKSIYWWEWSHRLIARLLGVVYLLPFVFFWLMSEIPARIFWRSWVAIGLVAFQGLVGWLMVASGLSKRVFVAPEMLMFHLGMAFLLLGWTLWTGLEAGEGEARHRGAPFKWRLAAGIIAGLVYLQCLLGALVAGNQAGLVYNDWPMMNGSFVPYTDWGQGIGMVLFHDQGVVQFMHRMNAYLLWTLAVFFAFLVSRRAQDSGLQLLAWAVAGTATLQATLGIATLYTQVNFWLALAHQLTAGLLLTLSLILAWSIFRAERAFRRSGFS